ncbi:hypothetical protein [Tautonia sociabilis]|nr:hypothetical protein [Tautonia sociabilis]
MATRRRRLSTRTDREHAPEKGGKQRDLPGEGGGRGHQIGSETT